MNKFYSLRAITIASYFGGPVAAGILAKQNFIAMGMEKHAKYALIIGIISTILIFGGIFLIPKDIIDKVPNALIPFIYTGIIYLIVDRYQGEALKEHKKNNGEFYSAWKAAGIGSICMVVYILGVVAYVLLSPDAFDAKKYNEGLAQFTKNEEKSLALYQMLGKSSDEKSAVFIDEQGLALWNENINILNELDKTKGLDVEFLKQDQVLRNYCNLRLKSYNLIRKALKEQSRAYDQEIKTLNSKIQDELSKFKKK